MTEQERFEAWLAKVCARPIPDTPVARIRLFAKELAEGTIHHFWYDTPFEESLEFKPSWSISYERYSFRSLVQTALSYDDRFDEIITFLHTRLEDKPLARVVLYVLRRFANEGWTPNDYSLQKMGYLSEKNVLLQTAYELLEQSEPATIFISYRRSDSSAFALLVLSRLKQHDLEAFLDMALQPGEDWHAGLKERIQQYDYFVVLLGKDTLQSEYVRKEILWAMEARLIILPIWHNGFEYKPEDWPDLEPEIDEVLRTRHTIRVVEENAREYDGALTELLNRFGVTPE